MIAFTQEQPDNVIAMPTKSNEWYTPARYIEAAREVMGSIDLDPASCKEANMVVRASKFYTQHDNGLVQPWYGNVWLNPPYGKTIPYVSKGRYMGGGNTKDTSLQVRFIRKAIQEYKNNHVEQAILLITANTTVAWFQSLWEYPICTPYPKIRFFVRDSREKQAQVFGNVFVYLGSHEQRFIDIFSKFGRIAKAIDTPKARPINLSLWEGSI